MRDRRYSQLDETEESNGDSPFSNHGDFGMRIALRDERRVFGTKERILQLRFRALQF